MTQRHFETTACVRAARDGDSTAVEALVARFTPWLLAQARYRLSGRLSALADPEDLVQDTWLIALPRLADLRPRAGRFTPVLVRFLSTVLKQRLQSLLERQLRRRPAHEPLLDQGLLASSVASGRMQAESRETAELVWAALRQLAERDQALIVLRGIEHAPFREIGLLLGMDANAAMVAWRRACERLRERLGPDLLGDLGDD